MKRAASEKDGDHLADIVGGVVLHWFNQTKRFLVASAGAGNAKSHGSSIPSLSVSQTHRTKDEGLLPDMGVVRFTEELNNPRAVIWLLEQQETKTFNYEQLRLTSGENFHDIGGATDL